MSAANYIAMRRVGRVVRYAQDPATAMFLHMMTRLGMVPQALRSQNLNATHGQHGPLMHELISDLLENHDRTALSGALDLHQDVTGESPIDLQALQAMRQRGEQPGLLHRLAILHRGLEGEDPRVADYRQQFSPGAVGAPNVRHIIRSALTRNSMGNDTVQSVLESLARNPSDAGRSWHGTLQGGLQQLVGSGYHPQQLLRVHDTLDDIAHDPRINLGENPVVGAQHHNYILREVFGHLAPHTPGR